MSTVANVFHTRLALAGVELEEEIQRLISAAVFGLIAGVMAFLAIVVATFTIVVAVPPEYRVWTMIGITVVYLAIAAILIARIKSIFSTRPPIFGATFAELEKDKETLTQMVRAHRMAASMKEPGDASRSGNMTPPPSTTSTPGA